MTGSAFILTTQRQDQRLQPIYGLRLSCQGIVSLYPRRYPNQHHPLHIPGLIPTSTSAIEWYGRQK